MPSFRTIDALEAKGTRVLVRADLNVPMKEGAVTDTARIDQAFRKPQHLSKILPPMLVQNIVQL